MKQYYVILYRHWQVNKQRWSTRVGVATEKPQIDINIHLAIVEVNATSKDEAVGIATEYIFRGYPSEMDCWRVFPARLPR